MYRVNVSQPSPTPTPNEEMLKLDIIEMLRKPFFSVYVLFDEVKIVLIKRRMDKTHLVQIATDNEGLQVIRLMHGQTILEINPVPGT